MNDPDLQTAIAAVTRFGLGARPGELEAARSDPRRRLTVQIRREGADQPEGSLRDSRASLMAFRQLRADVRDLKQGAAAAQANGNPGATAPDPKAAAQAIRAKRRMDYQPVRDEIAAEMLARTRLGATTPAGFRERWTLFWAHHFTVSAAKLKSAVLDVRQVFKGVLSDHCGLPRQTLDNQVFPQSAGAPAVGGLVAA